MKSERSLRSIQSHFKPKHSNSPTYSSIKPELPPATQKKAFGANHIKINHSQKHYEEDWSGIRSNSQTSLTKKKIIAE